MTRTVLAPRRGNVTKKVLFLLPEGKELHILVTIGFGPHGPAEVFCADFKAGTTLHSLVMDACVVISRLLQEGYLPSQLLPSMCQGPSLIQILLKAAAEEEQ